MENQEVQATGADSADAEKMYYEQMYHFMNVALPLPTTKETPDIKELQRKLKKFVSVVGSVSNHDWSIGIAEIQEAWGNYLLTNKIDEKRVKRMTEAMSAHLQFLFLMAEHRAVMKQLCGILNIHHIKVGTMIKQMEDRQKTDGGLV